MKQRVECYRCKAHRDVVIAPRCLVCGAESFLPVGPTLGDLDPTLAELVACAELIDTAVHAGDVICLDHPLALRLAEACRVRALSKAGGMAPLTGMQLAVPDSTGFSLGD